MRKRDLKDRHDVVAMTANKCVRADTVRSNATQQTCYRNNIIILHCDFVFAVSDLVNRTEYTV